jgi:hypothetical protein
MNGLIVVFLLGALAGVNLWLVFARARSDMEWFVRNFPSSSDASSAAPATYPKIVPGRGAVRAKIIAS